MALLKNVVNSSSVATCSLSTAKRPGIVSLLCVSHFHIICMNVLHSSCVKSSGSLWTNKSLSSSQWPDFTRKMSKSLSWETVRKNRCFPFENPFIVNHNQKRFITNGSIFHFKSVSFAGWISEEWVKLVCTHGFMNALDIWHSDSKTQFFLTRINHLYWAAQIPPFESAVQHLLQHRSWGESHWFPLRAAACLVLIAY